jgi:hypothetical protein
MVVLQHGGELWADKRAPSIICVCVIVTRRRFNADFIFSVPVNMGYNSPIKANTYQF